MKIDVYVDTVKDASCFNTIVRQGLLNMPVWLKAIYKNNKEMDDKIQMKFHIKDKEAEHID